MSAKVSMSASQMLALGLVGAGFLQQALDLAEDLLGWPVTLVLGLAAT